MIELLTYTNLPICWIRSTLEILQVRNLLRVAAIVKRNDNNLDDHISTRLMTFVSKNLTFQSLVMISGD